MIQTRRSDCWISGFEEYLVDTPEDDARTDASQLARATIADTDCESILPPQSIVLAYRFRTFLLLLSGSHYSPVAGVVFSITGPKRVRVVVTSQLQKPRQYPRKTSGRTLLCSVKELGI